MAVTARDVAAAAQVSAATVSRALSAPQMVAPQTRARVLQVARELGYRPNQAAHGLVTGRTHTIGLVVPDLENPFFASVTKGVQSRARAAGYAVFVADSDEDAGVEVDLVRALAKEVDGIVLCSPRASDAEIESLALECPLVLVNRRTGSIPAVTVANEDGVRQAVAHLHALGHRRIAYAGGPRTSWSDSQRLSAFRTIGGDLADAELVELGHFQPYFSGGIAAADLAIASRATAVLAYNDLVAVGLLSRLAQRGVSVPADMSVMGIDNVPVSELVIPALTTVALPRVTCGRAGVDLLLSLVDGSTPGPATGSELGVELIVRQSTGTPPAPPSSDLRDTREDLRDTREDLRDTREDLRDTQEDRDDQPVDAPPETRRHRREEHP